MHSRGFSFLILTLLAITLQASIEIYPSLPTTGELAALPSETYQVEVFQGGPAQAAFVHLSRARTEGPGSQFIQGRTVAWTDFSLDGPATVRVSALTGTELPAGEVTIYPLRHRIKATRQAGAVVFEIPGPGHYLVTFGETGFEHPVAIFANPKETNPPDLDGPGVLRVRPGIVDDLARQAEGHHTIHFAPGIYELGGEVILPAGTQRVHLAGGALVFGALQINHDDVTVDGRGTLSGLHLAHKTHHIVETPGHVKRTLVEGVTVADFPYFAVRLLGSDSAINWVKTIGAWIYNCDGFVAWKGSTMSNSFIMANDDAIKIYDSDVTVRDCVTWNLTNGASLQLGWSSLEAHNVHVDGLDVIRAEWRPQGNSQNNSVVNLRLAQGGGNTQSHFVFENIRVDTPVLRIIDLRMIDGRKGSVSEHRIKDFLFLNIDAKMLELENNPNNYNYIIPASADFGFENIRFENLVINGIAITNENAATDGRFRIDPAAAPEVSFSTTNHSASPVHQTQ